MDAPAQMSQRADLRDFLAAERTFLAWIRTGLALMGFGFVEGRFGLFLQQLQVVQGTSPAPSYGLSLWFGTALIAAGVVVYLLSAWHHLRLVRELERGIHVLPSIDSGGGDRVVPGFGGTRDGDLFDFRPKLRESTTRKYWQRGGIYAGGSKQRNCREA